MKTQIKPSRVLLFIVLLLLAVVMIIPFVWMLSSSFKYNTEIFSYPIKWIPEVFRWDNYKYVWTEITFPTYFFNSLKLSVIVTVGQIIFCSLAAYSFSKLHYPGRDKLFLLYLATMMVPWHAIMIPQFIVVNKLGLYNSHWALILINLFSAFGIFILRQSMISIPKELLEAARIDGCSEFRTYTQIIMPMCKPAIACALNDDAVTIDLVPVGALKSPRLRVTPANGFNHLPADGETIRWGTQRYVLSRRK